MDLRTLTPGLAVCAQITPDDVAALKAQGVRSIICNRPDQEEAGQPDFADIAAAARAAGITARYIPVKSGMVTEADAAAFGAALEEMPRPVVAYCRSGSRSASLWSMQEAAAGSTASPTG